MFLVSIFAFNNFFLTIYCHLRIKKCPDIKEQSHCFTKQIFKVDTFKEKKISVKAERPTYVIDLLDEYLQKCRFL